MKLKYKRCKPSKRIYRNLALGILTFLIIATVLPVAVHPAEPVFCDHAVPGEA
jgi:hypothetical protein